MLLASGQRLKKCVFYVVLLILPVMVLFGFDRCLIFFGLPAEKTRHPRNFAGVIKTPEFQIELKTNSQGLRYRELPLQKPASQFRVLMLGDSCTEGWGVEMHQTSSAVMEQMAADDDRDAAFINAGVSTFSVTDYERLLQEIGLTYPQDAVLVNVYANDLTGVNRHKDKPLKFLHTVLPRLHTMLWDVYLYGSTGHVYETVPWFESVPERSGSFLEEIAAEG